MSELRRKWQNVSHFTEKKEKYNKNAGFALQKYKKICTIKKNVVLLTAFYGVKGREATKTSTKHTNPPHSGTPPQRGEQGTILKQRKKLINNNKQINRHATNQTQTWFGHPYGWRSGEDGR